MGGIIQVNNYQCQEKNGNKWSMSKKISHFQERLKKTISDMDGGNVSKFARNAGINRSNVKAWLEGRGEPKRENLFKLINYTEKPERYFYPDLTLNAEVDKESLPVGESAVKYRSGIDLTKAESDLIEALREIDPISRAGIYSSAIEMLVYVQREKEVKRNKRKKDILERAVKSLGKAIHES